MNLSYSRPPDLHLHLRANKPFSVCLSAGLSALGLQKHTIKDGEVVNTKQLVLFSHWSNKSTSALLCKTKWCRGEDTNRFSELFVSSPSSLVTLCLMLAVFQLHIYWKSMRCAQTPLQTHRLSHTRNYSLCPDLSVVNTPERFSFNNSKKGKKCHRVKIANIFSQNTVRTFSGIFLDAPEGVKAVQ